MDTCSSFPFRLRILNLSKAYESTHARQSVPDSLSGWFRSSAFRTRVVIGKLCLSPLRQTRLADHIQDVRPVIGKLYLSQRWKNTRKSWLSGKVTTVWSVEQPSGVGLVSEGEDEPGIEIDLAWLFNVWLFFSTSWDSMFRSFSFCSFLLIAPRSKWC